MVHLELWLSKTECFSFEAIQKETIRIYARGGWVLELPSGNSNFDAKVARHLLKPLPKRTRNRRR